MKRLAVISSYSTHCEYLIKQCFMSCHQSVLKQNDCNATYFAYQLNWVIGTKNHLQYNPLVKIQPEISSLNVIDIDGNIEMESYLPDIVAYDHFAKNYLQDYDYALFCHNDMFFHDSNMIKECIVILDKPQYDIIANPHVECSDILSVRFYPNFIFVNAKKFLQNNLSFCNNLQILHDSQRRRNIKKDGGAEFMASYYKNKSPNCQPYTYIPPNWFEHLKLGNDNGIETYNLNAPRSPQFIEIIDRCRKYVDSKLYA